MEMIVLVSSQVSDALELPGMSAEMYVRCHEYHRQQPELQRLSVRLTPL